MRRLVSIVPVVLACVVVGRALAGGSPEQLMSDEELVPRYAVALVATVTSASDAASATNGSPPRVGLEVQERLRGDVPAALCAVWRPRPHDVDWSGEGAKEARDRWAREPCPPPAIGAKLILFGELSEGTFLVSPRCRFPVTDEKLAWVKKLLEKSPRR